MIVACLDRSYYRLVRCDKEGHCVIVFCCSFLGTWLWSSRTLEMWPIWIHTNSSLWPKTDTTKRLILSWWITGSSIHLLVWFYFI